MPLTSPGNDDDTGENHQPTLRKNTAEPVEQTLKQNNRFAFANIERWTRDGVDVMAMPPYLAAYMGHAGIDSTLYYVHASPDFMDGYADLVADAERVVPETEEP